MRNLIILLFVIVPVLFNTALYGQSSGSQSFNKQTDNSTAMENKVVKPESEWKTCLSPEQYQVLREKGTELPFTGKYYHYDKDGIYICAACGNKLFTSDTKYDSGSGWPSFFKPVSENAVEVRKDLSAGMVRLEIVCGKCGSHLGHVFSDGPQPTGLRYCVNSLSLNFKDKEK